jgi:hypothetical protein
MPRSFNVVGQVVGVTDRSHTSRACRDVWLGDGTPDSAAVLVRFFDADWDWSDEPDITYGSWVRVQGDWRGADNYLYAETFDRLAEQPDTGASISECLQAPRVCLMGRVTDVWPLGACNGWDVRLTSPDGQSHYVYMRDEVPDHAVVPQPGDRVSVWAMETWQGARTYTHALNFMNYTRQTLPVYDLDPVGMTLNTLMTLEDLKDDLESLVADRPRFSESTKARLRSAIAGLHAVVQVEHRQQVAAERVPAPSFGPGAAPVLEGVLAPADTPMPAALAEQADPSLTTARLPTLGQVLTSSDSLSWNTSTTYYYGESVIAPTLRVSMPSPTDVPVGLDSV